MIVTRANPAHDAGTTPVRRASGFAARGPCAATPGPSHTPAGPRAGAVAVPSGAGGWPRAGSVQSRDATRNGDATPLANAKRLHATSGMARCD